MEKVLNYTQKSASILKNIKTDIEKIINTNNNNNDEISSLHNKINSIQNKLIQLDSTYKIKLANNTKKKQIIEKEKENNQIIKNKINDTFR